MILEIVDEAVASGARLSRACQVIELPARTLQRWRIHGPQGGQDGRHGPTTPPANKLSAQEYQQVLNTVNSDPYRNLPPKQIVPRLADQGKYIASESTIYRILEAEGLNAHRQRSKPATQHRPAERIATGPCQLLCWDITYLPAAVKGNFYFLYLYLDIWSRKILAWGVHDEQCGEFASNLLMALCDDHDVTTDGVVLHSDNGKPMKGSSMLSTMQWLGIVPSFSRPHVSDDNPYVEALFRTLKYCPQYPHRPFQSLQEAVDWVELFVAWYNNQHLHSGIGFVTPQDRHTGRDIPILAQRREVYRKARARHPERWARLTRGWKRPVIVRLHPDREALTLQPKQRHMA